MGKFIDLTGQRFGRLTVLSRAENIISSNGRKYIAWNCQCDCGNQHIVKQEMLISGHTRSCGCLKRETGSKRIIDLTGKKFGRLTVLKKSEVEHKNHIAYWICQCDCGNVVEVAGASLRSGGTKSCGCYKIDRVIERSIKTNDYLLFDDHAEIVLSTGDHALIDLDDVEKCKKYYWYLNDQGYVLAYLRGSSSTKMEFIRLHRYLMDVDDDKEVDHKFGDPLDNRKAYLRVCDLEENKRNKRAISGNYPGVHYSATRDRWIAEIWMHNNGKKLGYFKTERDAIEARINAEDKYYGEFGYYNSRIKPNVKNKEEYLNGFSETDSKRN